MATILWYHQDLRTADHAALAWAAARGPVVPVFVHWPESGVTPGAASAWWLHHSLESLDASLRRLGAPLILRRGLPELELPALAAEVGADCVVWSAATDPEHNARRAALSAALDRAGIAYRAFGGSLLHDPDTIRTGSGGPYKVFTPFYRKFSALVEPSPPAPPPDSIRAVDPPARSDSLESWELLPRIPWDTGLRAAWHPGESGAHELLSEFVPGGPGEYADRRDIPAERGTSRLSPHLHFGELSPAQVWFAAAGTGETSEPFLRQIVWREFAHHLLHHFPYTVDRALREPYDAFPWISDAAGLKRWQRGQTGYPIVDAGMRELWTTGWMHNRVRMIVASFLTKDLLMDWREGKSWFDDTLVDADAANNTMGWQWAAGSGADAQPFFRIFNPVKQGQKFDSDGRYVRRWVPELAGLPDRYLHAPWTAPQGLLRDAGVVLGDTYPHPVVDHGAARDRALEAYQTIR